MTPHNLHKCAVSSLTRLAVDLRYKSSFRSKMQPSEEEHIALRKAMEKHSESLFAATTWAEVKEVLLGVEQFLKYTDKILSASALDHCCAAINAMRGVEHDFLMVAQGHP